MLPLPEWKEDLDATYRKVRGRVGHVLSRMKDFKIFCGYRRAASTLTLTDTVCPLSVDA